MENAKLYDKIAKRLELLDETLPASEKAPLSDILEENGFNRRDFMKWSAMVTAMLALPSTFTPLVAKATEVSTRIPVVWLHFAECTGCSESFIRTDAPSVENLIFDVINLEYHETLMAASGWQTEEILEGAMEKHKGKYLLVVEGGIPTGNTGDFLTTGTFGRKAEDTARKVAADALAVFAVGTCSSYGGIQAAYPNPSNAQKLSSVISKPVINIPGCPPSDRNIVGTFLYYILTGSLPALDAFGRPKWAYELRIHDLCERRGHFDAGEFVQEFGDEYAKKGFCLYKMGCKGPYTFNNCSRERFNQHTSWPVQAGHGCIGCSEPDFWDTMTPFEEPLADRLYQSAIEGRGVDRTADSIGSALLVATGVGIAAHAAVAAFKKPKKVVESEDE